jgi:hypothetical protein
MKKLVLNYRNMDSHSKRKHVKHCLNFMLINSKSTYLACLLKNNFRYFKCFLGFRTELPFKISLSLTVYDSEECFKNLLYNF